MANQSPKIVDVSPKDYNTKTDLLTLKDLDASNDAVFQFCMEYFRLMHSAHREEQLKTKELRQKLDDYSASNEILRRNLSQACQMIWALKSNPPSDSQMIFDSSTYICRERTENEEYADTEDVSQSFRDREVIKNLIEEIVQLKRENYELKLGHEEEEEKQEAALSICSLLTQNESP
jgi:hypothetical protein